ncbi:MAG: hypothetical protein L6Q49_19160 [Anaerolineales bacterium]|nr:hypothetical protein [Anaerolineales bacterium]
MTESENTPVYEEKNRSGGALALFLMFVLPMPLCLFIYHFILWTTEQSAIVSSSLQQLARAGAIGLASQAVLMSLLFGLLWYFTTDDRFKGWYAGMFGASLFGFPALALRFLGANNDQVGLIAQTLLAFVAALIVIRFGNNKPAWLPQSAPFGLFRRRINCHSFW